MRAFRPGLLALAMLLPITAGCMVNEAPPTRMADAPDTMMRPAVVALIDSGINPYHVAFQAPAGLDAAAYAEEFGAEVIQLSRSPGYTESMASDEEVWAAMKPNTLYAFAGTRVFGISMSQDTPGPPVVDVYGHGTGTLSMAAREAPGALLVMVQVDGRLCTADSDCPTFSPPTPAMQWIAEQSWIDVVSVSMGYPGNPPIPSSADPDVAPYLAASRKAYEDGKIMVVGAGNTAVPPLVSYFAGPPWVIAVGGAEAKPRSDSTYASKNPDIVSNYTDLVASHLSMEDMKWASGTSFATPIVAGILAAALAHLRATSEETITPEVLRMALHASAREFTAAEWNPRNRTTDSLLDDLSATTVPVLTPGFQQGWGYVNGTVVPEIVRRVIEQDFTIPPEKAPTATYMAQWQSLRETYWQNAP